MPMPPELYRQTCLNHVRLWPQRQPDAEVAELERHLQREIAPPVHLEVRVQLFLDLVGQIDVLALDEPAVALSRIPFLEDALGRDLPGQGICHAPFAGDDDLEHAALLVAKAIRLADGGGEVREVLEDVDREDAIEETVVERQAFLA